MFNKIICDVIICSVFLRQNLQIKSKCGPLNDYAINVALCFPTPDIGVQMIKQITGWYID